MKEKLKNFKYGIIIFIVAVVVSIPLFWKNLNVYADDRYSAYSKRYINR